MSMSPSPSPRHDDRGRARLRPHDRNRIVHGEHGHRRRVGPLPDRPGEVTDLAALQLPGNATAEALDGAESGRNGFGQRAPQGARRNDRVPIGAQIGPHQHVAHPHEAGDRRERIGLERAFLHSTIERPQQVEALGRSPRHELSGHIGPVHEAGFDRLARVAPAVRREVRSGEREHAGVVRSGVQRRDRPLPVAGDLPAFQAGREIARRASPAACSRCTAPRR